MTKTETKLPVKKGPTEPSWSPFEWRPFESLRRQVDRLFEDFPFRKALDEFEPFERLGWVATPAVDLVEKDKEYEITAELPGLDEKNVAVKLSNGSLTISGEKKEEKEEKERDYYLSERRFGAFKRVFRVPEGVDVDKIDASFDKGVLTVHLPKAPEAQKPEKTIAIKAK